MTLKINSLAPDFKAKTSEGDISFHEWLGDSWGVFASVAALLLIGCGMVARSVARSVARPVARRVQWQRVGW